MGKIAVCKNCGELYDYNPRIKYEGGISYTTVTCSKCGYTKTENTNYIHYGNDGIK